MSRPTAGDLALGWWERFAGRAAVTQGSRRARSFSSFGRDAVICFPPVALYGERAIRIGDETVVGPYASLSAGMDPAQDLVSDHIVTIGARCRIGRFCSIVGHFEIVIGDDVFFGPNVYVTDQNHAFADPDVPIGRQSALEEPVHIGDQTWVGANAVILPGVTIGRRCVVGAGAVVTRDVPDGAVVVGSPARPVSATGEI